MDIQGSWIARVGIMMLRGSLSFHPPHHHHHSSSSSSFIIHHSSSSSSVSASPWHILYATLLHEPQSATNLSSVLLCRLRALPGGEVWSYGRSNSDVQQKMLKRLEEYEEVGCWSMWAEHALPRFPKLIPGAESCSRIALTESQTQRFRLCFKNTVDHFVSAERIQRQYREVIETYYAWWPFPTSMLVKLEARKQLATVGWADFEQRGLQVKI